MIQANQFRYYSDKICIMSFLTFEGVNEPLLYTIENYKKAIPPGEYRCVPYYSEKLAASTGRGDVWAVNGDHGKTGVAIHVANLATQLEGCIAPGLSAGASLNVKNPEIGLWNAVHSSKHAMNKIRQIVESRSIVCVMAGVKIGHYRTHR